jgi:putative ABC transport system substrate-binding protein
MFASEAKRIADLALAERLPMMAWGGWFTKTGGLMAYSADYGNLLRRLAVYVDKVLKGAQPGNLPIEQPARFELSLNLRTARTLGFTISHELLARADWFIE